MESRTFGEIIILILVMIVIISGVVMLTPNSAMGKLKNAVDNVVDKWLAGIKGEKIRQQEDITPKETKDVFYDIKEMFGKTGNGCIIEHPDFSRLDNYAISLSNSKDGVYIGLIEKPIDKEKAPIKMDMTDKKNFCVVAGTNKDGIAAENFIKYYIKEDQQYKDKLKYTNPKEMIIKDKETIILDGRESDLKDDNMVFVDGDSVCFFPTYKTGVKWYNPITLFTKWGCDVSEGGMDDDCIKEIKDKKPSLFCKDVKV